MVDQFPHDESTLILLLRQGDEEAFEILYNRYWEKLLTVAYHRIGSMEVAKELVQDVFANLWRRRQQLTIKTTFGAYIFSAMKYTVLDYIRAQVVKEKYVAAIKNAVHPTDNTTVDFIAYEELNRTLEQEIGKLPEKCGMVFRLSRMEHYSTKEIAEKLQISPKTVENQITKALKLLRVNLREFTTLLVLLFSLFFLR
jgi:RNA polymerase sigma-70 factor (family 1)